MGWTAASSYDAARSKVATRRGNFVQQQHPRKCTSAVHLRITYSLTSSVVTLLACLKNQLWCEFSAMYSYKSCTAVVHWHSEQQRRFEDPHTYTFHSNPSAPKKYNLLKTISFSLMLRETLHAYCRVTQVFLVGSWNVRYSALLLLLLTITTSREFQSFLRQTTMWARHLGGY